MKTKWKEMNGKEKGLLVLYFVIIAIAAVFAVLDFSNTWEYADIGWSFYLAIMCVVECLQSWNNNRKAAFMELGCCVLFLIAGIVNIIN